MKKLNKLFAILVAMAMVLSLSAISAFAALDPNQTSADAKLVKYLKLDSGVTIPTDNFTFRFKKVSVPEGSELDTFVYDGIATSAMSKSVGTEDGGSVVKAIDLKSVFTGDHAFDKAGVYKFTVKEVAGSVQGMTYDDSEFTVTAYVVKGTDGYTVDHFTVQKGENDKENITINDPTTVKPQPGSTDTGIGFTFVNSYTAPTPRTEATAALKVKKEVSGNYADDKAAYPFTLTLTNTDTRYDATIPAYISVNGTKKANSDINFALNGSNNTFALVPGEELVIVNLPAGTTFAVKENLNNAPVQRLEAYSADAEKQADTAIDITKSYDGTADRDLTITGASAITDNNIANGYTVTNTATDPEPEGILISNLPYIALALVAIGGLVAYVVVRRRNADEA